ncbi:MAG: hypothetical protein O2807_02445 [bacterium]|nr:hypothetical protein [bacterium]
MVKIEIQGAKKTFQEGTADAVVALDGVNLSIQEKEFLSKIDSSVAVGSVNLTFSRA